jgi:hypothetical protein
MPQLRLHLATGLCRGRGCAWSHGVAKGSLRRFATVVAAVRQAHPHDLTE